LGSGGIGEVSKAPDKRLDRIVVIRILPKSLASDPQFRDGFDREARKDLSETRQTASPSSSAWAGSPLRGAV
jgi:serine/threonine protein kinase